MSPGERNPVRGSLTGAGQKLRTSRQLRHDPMQKLRTSASRISAPAGSRAEAGVLRRPLYRKWLKEPVEGLFWLLLTIDDAFDDLRSE
jgi:hypothetical protein